MLCNNSLFVGQLYEDKSLALHARDLIFFTTDLQTVNYYTTIHALELIYFLIIYDFLFYMYNSNFWDKMCGQKLLLYKGMILVLRIKENLPTHSQIYESAFP